MPFEIQDSRKRGLDTPWERRNWNNLLIPVIMKKKGAQHLEGVFLYFSVLIFFYLPPCKGGFLDFDCFGRVSYVLPC